MIVADIEILEDIVKEASHLSKTVEKLKIQTEAIKVKYLVKLWDEFRYKEFWQR